MKTALAILAGFLTTVILAVGTDAVLKTLHPGQTETSSPALLAATLAYTQIYAAVGGFVAARIARNNPMQAVLILAAIAFVLTALISFSGGNNMPLWYKAASLLLLVPFTYLGGRVAAKRINRSA